MAKRGPGPHNRRRKAGQAKRGQARPVRRPQARPRDLLAAVRHQLTSGEPLDFVAYVSALLAAIDPRGQHPFQPDHGDLPERTTLPTLLESFAEVELPETTALLAAVAELGPDDLTRARARRALTARSHPLPDWLARLGETTVYRRWRALMSWATGTMCYSGHGCRARN